MLKRKTQEQSGEPTQQKPLRLWPGVVAVVLLWLARFGLKIAIPGYEGFELAIMGGFLGMFAVVVWWAFFSRAPHFERWGAIALMIIAMFATWHINHESMGPLWLAGYAAPVLLLAFVAWAVASSRLSDMVRRVTMVATILLACGVWTLIRTGGIDGDHVADFAWRWSESPEEKLLSQAGDEPMAPVTDSLEAEMKVGWPGFRGPNRDGIIRGVQVETDWSASPPKELWRKAIGPGWSSFAVSGDLLYTQEQRGENELVTCYSMRTGDMVWKHTDRARFYESNGGAGPRGTPTLSGGYVYTLGGTGILNALDARDGAVAWSRNAGSDTDTNVPIWGFSSSPLVVEDVVIIAAAGSFIAYDVASGEMRWSIPDSGDCYSSPHQLTIDGVTQIVLLNEAGASSVTPADGKLLWKHQWPGHPIVQPALTENGDVLISVSERSGIRRIAVAKGQDGWTITERWTSDRLSPYFNDFVIHKNHIYGLSSHSLMCIDLDDGARLWKGARYGNGQLILLADQNLLLVLSEKGKLALVKAAPDQYTELARFHAIKGKTWNHPVLVGDILLVRNAQEMAAFRLPMVGG